VLDRAVDDDVGVVSATLGLVRDLVRDDPPRLRFR
jgi:hypothetical protein